MRIATWNINGFRARFDYLTLWLKERQPDVVALQELKTADEVFPFTDCEELGYTAMIHGQKAWNGVALMVRSDLELEITDIGLPGQEEFGARLLAGRTEDLNICSLYCPNGKNVEHEDYQRKLTWFDDLRAWIDSRYSPESQLLLCGDFNICPGPLDSWDEDKLAGSIFHTKAERKRLGDLEGWGLIDVFRHLHPEEQAFSWWDYRRMAFRYNRGLRIDLVLATQTAASRITALSIDRDFRKKKEGLTASDHAPVIAELG